MAQRVYVDDTARIDPGLTDFLMVYKLRILFFSGLIILRMDVWYAKRRWFDPSCGHTFSLFFQVRLKKIPMVFTYIGQKISLSGV